MLPYDLHDVLGTVFRWTTALQGAVLALGLFVCVRTGMAIGKRCVRHPKLKWATAIAVLVGSCLCVAVFIRNLQEDYAYVVLGGESEYNVPYAMRWLVENGRERRLIRTVRAPFNEDDTGMRNTRLYAAMVLAKKDSDLSQKVLATVPPFGKSGCANPSYVFGTNRYSFPVAGQDVLQMEWNDGTNHIPYEWKTVVEAW